MDNITNLIVAIIGIVGTILTAVVIPLIREKLSNEQRENLYNIVMIACKAADQLAKTGVLDKAARHEHVIAFLESKGITYDVDEVNEMIESIVLELPPLIKEEKKETTTKTKKATSTKDTPAK